MTKFRLMSFRNNTRALIHIHTHTDAHPLRTRTIHAHSHTQLHTHNTHTHTHSHTLTTVACCFWLPMRWCTWAMRRRQSAISKAWGVRVQMAKFRLMSFRNNTHALIQIHTHTDAHTLRTRTHTRSCTHITRTHTHSHTLTIVACCFWLPVRWCTWAMRRRQSAISKTWGSSVHITRIQPNSLVCAPSCVSVCVRVTVHRAVGVTVGADVCKFYPVFWNAFETLIRNILSDCFSYCLDDLKLLRFGSGGGGIYSEEGYSVNKTSGYIHKF
jgi:uncharacterized membrane protein